MIKFFGGVALAATVAVLLNIFGNEMILRLFSRGDDDSGGAVCKSPGYLNMTTSESGERVWTIQNT
jgi:hypothetical protein